MRLGVVLSSETVQEGRSQARSGAFWRKCRFGLADGAGQRRPQYSSTVWSGLGWGGLEDWEKRNGALAESHSKQQQQQQEARGKKGR